MSSVMHKTRYSPGTFSRNEAHAMSNLHIIIHIYTHKVHIAYKL